MTYLSHPSISPSLPIIPFSFIPSYTVTYPSLTCFNHSFPSSLNKQLSPYSFPSSPNSFPQHHVHAFKAHLSFTVIYSLLSLITYPSRMLRSSFLLVKTHPEKKITITEAMRSVFTMSRLQQSISFSYPSHAFYFTLPFSTLTRRRTSS